MSLTTPAVSQPPVPRLDEDQARSAREHPNLAANPPQDLHQGAVVTQPASRGASSHGDGSDVPGNLMISSPPKVPPAGRAVPPAPVPAPASGSAPTSTRALLPPSGSHDANTRIDDFVKGISNDVPDLRRFAGQKLKGIFKDTFKLDVQPENLRVVTVDYRKGKAPPYRGAIYAATPVTDALINMVQSYPTVKGVPVPWRKDAPSVRLEKGVFSPPPNYHYPSVDKNGESSVLPNSYVGIFSTKQTPGLGDVLDGKTQVPVSPAALSRAIWDADLLGSFQRNLKSFWAKHRDTYPIAAKAAFLKEVERQKANGTLSSEGYDLARRMTQVAAGTRWTDVKPDELKRGRANDPDIDTGALDIDGYPATDLLYARDRKNELTLLYAAGDPSPIHTFQNIGAMKAWLADQAHDPETRNALAGHFSIRDRYDGLTKLGIDKGLLALGDARRESVGDTRPLESITTTSSIEPFTTLAGRIEKRAADDAESLISTRADYYKGIATPIIKALKYPAGLLGTIFPAVGGPILAGLGMADSAIGLHDVANGKDGSSQATGGIIDLASATSARKKTGPELTKTPSPRTSARTPTGQREQAHDAESHAPVSDPRPSPTSSSSNARSVGQKTRSTAKDHGTTKPESVEKARRGPNDAHVTSRLSPDVIKTLDAMDDKRHFVGIMNVKTRGIYIFPSALVGNPGSGTEGRMPLPSGFRYKPGRYVPMTSLASGDFIRFQKNSNGLLGHAALAYVINGNPDDFVGFSGIKEGSNAFRLDWSAPTLNPRYAHSDDAGGEDVLRDDLRAAVTRRFEKAAKHIES